MITDWTVKYTPEERKNAARLVWGLLQPMSGQLVHLFCVARRLVGAK
jgi:hypothetical protein